MKIPRCRFIAVLIILLHICVSSKAQSTGTAFGSSVGAVSGATGGAGVAASDIGEQVLLNPAAIVHGGSFAMGYFYRGGSLGPSERNQNITVTIMDNSPDIMFSGGFLYSQETLSYLSTPDAKAKRLQVSMASFIFKQFSYGASAYHYEVDADGLGNFSTVKFNFGLMWNPSPIFAMGFHAENMGGKQGGLFQFYSPKDRVTLGMNYLFMPQFRFRADVSQQTEFNPDGKFDLRGGFESFIDAFLVLRVGYENAALLDRNFLTAGFGFTGPRVQIDYAYRADTGHSDGALHSVDFRLPF